MFKKTFLLLPLLTAVMMLVACGGGDDGGGSTPPVAVTGVSLTPASASSNPIEIPQGSSAKLTAVIAPANAANKSVTWSMPTTVTGITVDTGGKVSVAETVAINTTATIEVKTADGNKTASAYIKVIAMPSAETMKPAVPVALPSSGIDFPIKADDTGTGNIKHKFELAQTEVTYELWKKVYDWATDVARGGNVYKFANAGKLGSSGSGDAKQPVTTVSWRDVIVWCNAYTEWSNASKGTSYGVVYKKGAAILRDATVTADVDALTFDPTTNTATGFRLPTSAEWEFAARWQGTVDKGNSVKKTNAGVDYFFTKGNSASGATLPIGLSGLTLPSGKTWADLRDEAARVAVYDEWYDGTGWVDQTPATTSSASVGGKAANALGLYDMSGNVWEWCFDSSGANRVVRGGSWNDNANYLQVGNVFDGSPDGADVSLGFRLARSPAP